MTKHHHFMPDEDTIQASGFKEALDSFLSLLTEAYSAGDLTVTKITRIEFVDNDEGPLLAIDYETDD